MVDREFVNNIVPLVSLGLRDTFGFPWALWVPFGSLPIAIGSPRLAALGFLWLPPGQLGLQLAALWGPFDCLAVL